MLRHFTLYIGVVHKKDDEEDFVDIKFITDSKEQADIEFLIIKKYANKTLKLKCVIDTENYLLFKSLNEKTIFESFYIERILIIKGGKIDEK